MVLYICLQFFLCLFFSLANTKKLIEKNQIGENLTVHIHVHFRSDGRHQVEDADVHVRHYGGGRLKVSCNGLASLPGSEL